MHVSLCIIIIHVFLEMVLLLLSLLFLAIKHNCQAKIFYDFFLIKAYHIYHVMLDLSFCFTSLICY